jgi:hypothetical protein
MYGLTDMRLFNAFCATNVKATGKALFTFIEDIRISNNKKTCRSAVMLQRHRSLHDMRIGTAQWGHLVPFFVRIFRPCTIRRISIKSVIAGLHERCLGNFVLIRHLRNEMGYLSRIVKGLGAVPSRHFVTASGPTLKSTQPPM